jgi:glycogen debranching enzyme
MAACLHYGTKVMPTVQVRPDILYAWKGPSLLIVDTRGECGEGQDLSGYYYREARFLRTLRFAVNGKPPWFCEAADLAPDSLAFTFVYPELTEFGGGGSGQSGDDYSTDEQGIRHRALVIRLTYATLLNGLRIDLDVSNHSPRPVECDLAWTVDADFADIQEAQSGRREQEAGVIREHDAQRLTLTYQDARLPYRTVIEASGPADWTMTASHIAGRVRLLPQRPLHLQLSIHPGDQDGVLGSDGARQREEILTAWRDDFTQVRIPGNRVAERIVAGNIRDFASFPLLDGQRDEWLALQAGMPLYPALFGRDTLTASWQCAFVDRAAALDASLTRLGRLQSDRVDDWRDAEPGRIPYQVRSGPLALLNLNPYAAYYADFASPLMFVISLAHAYAWTGDKGVVRRHWDVARRILDWARTSGDGDGDGYLEYETRSSKGTKNQGWKDSGDAVIYEDGRPVPAPLGTCEIQGYWFAAQQAMAVLSWVIGERADAKAYWRAARALKQRFNRDWWIDRDGFIAFARDPEKRMVPGITSNAGHCVACGIVSDDHLPAVVDRLFAPDMFSGWGIRTLSTQHAVYNPLSYHCGSVWGVEQGTIAFGLRRFGFETRAQELARGQFDLAELYPEGRIPECVGGFAREGSGSPGAYPRTNTPQLWNASAIPLLIHTLLGLQPVAALDLLVIDPALPDWLPEIVLENLRLSGATASLRFWRDAKGRSHGEVLRKHGTFRLVRQPPPESLSHGLGDRLGALVESVWP